MVNSLQSWLIVDGDPVVLMESVGAVMANDAGLKEMKTVDEIIIRAIVNVKLSLIIVDLKIVIELKALTDDCLFMHYC